MALQPPLPLAMVLADGIHQDQATQKFTILGTFSVLGSAQFPARHPQLAVYMALTDCEGKQPASIKLVAVTNDGDRDLLEVGFELDFVDRLAVLEAVFVMGNLVFPTPGEYRLQLYVAGDFVIERRIVAITPHEVRNEEGSGNDDPDGSGSPD